MRRSNGRPGSWLPSSRDEGVSSRDLATRTVPEAVGGFSGILADWLGSFTMPAPLGAEMADALGEGSDWVGAIASRAVRRAGWPDTESVAWGICVAALAGAFEAARRSLDGAAGSRDPGATADGPARSLLAADGLIAAAHETLASLGADRLLTAIQALEEEFGDGGPWRHLAAAASMGDVRAGGPPPAWPRFVALALAPAAAERPDGPWADLGAAWRERHGGSPVPGAGQPAPDRRADDALCGHPGADEWTTALLRAAADAAAGRPGPDGTVDGL